MVLNYQGHEGVVQCAVEMKGRAGDFQIEIHFGSKLFYGNFTPLFL